MSFYTNSLKQKSKLNLWRGISVVIGILFLMSLYSAGSVVKERDSCVSSLGEMEGKYTETLSELQEYKNDEKCSTITCMLDTVEYYWYEDGKCYCYGYNDEIVKVVEY